MTTKQDEKQFERWYHEERERNQNLQQAIVKAEKANEDLRHKLERAESLEKTAHDRRENAEKVTEKLRGFVAAMRLVMLKHEMINPDDFPADFVDGPPTYTSHEPEGQRRFMDEMMRQRW